MGSAFEIEKKIERYCPGFMFKVFPKGKIRDGFFFIGNLRISLTGRFWRSEEPGAGPCRGIVLAASAHYGIPPIETARRLSAFLEKEEQPSQRKEAKGGGTMTHNSKILPMPPAPKTYFHPKWEDLLSDAVESTGLDPAIPIGTSLALWSALIGCGRYVYAKGYKQPAILWIAIVGNSGVGKSVITDKIFSSYEELYAQHHERYHAEREQYEETLERWQKSKEGTKPQPPREKMALTGDPTPESWPQLFRDNPKGFQIHDDELISTILGLGRYQKAGIDSVVKGNLLKAFDARSIKINRKSTGTVYIKRGAIGLYGSIQPSLLKKAFTQADIDSGFYPRFCCIIGSKKKAVKWRQCRELTKESQKTLEFVTTKLWEIETRPNEEHLVGLSPDAEDVYADWHYFLEIQGLNREDSLCAKMQLITFRIALLIHTVDAILSKADTLAQISGQTMQRAVSLSEWLLKNNLMTIQLLTAEAKLENPIELAVKQVCNENMGMLARQGDKIANPVFQELVEAKLGYALDPNVLSQACKKVGIIQGQDWIGKDKAKRIPKSLIKTFQSQMALEALEALEYRPGGQLSSQHHESEGVGSVGKTQCIKLNTNASQRLETGGVGAKTRTGSQKPTLPTLPTPIPENMAIKTSPNKSEPDPGYDKSASKAVF